LKLFPAFRTRYFLGFGCGGKAAAAEIQKMSSNNAPIGARPLSIINVLHYYQYCHFEGESNVFGSLKKSIERL
jgi:hypothetical protein